MLILISSGIIINTSSHCFVQMKQINFSATTWILKNIKLERRFSDLCLHVLIDGYT